MSERVDHVPVRIPAGSELLAGDLRTPAAPKGLVIFAHGSGSSRHSPRNRFVAERLHEAGLATLLLDLLTPEEEHEDAVTREWRFDIPLLSRRLADAVRWAGSNVSTKALPIGLFGASTGAAAALYVAAARPEVVHAVVSRGGRPDLVMPALGSVRAPTRLVVGGDDEDVLRLNQIAYDAMRCEKDLFVVLGATHLFEEPGTLERAAQVSADWFAHHLGAISGTPSERAPVEAGAAPVAATSRGGGSRKAATAPRGAGKGSRGIGRSAP